MAKKTSKRKYKKKKMEEYNALKSEAYHIVKLLYYFLRHKPDCIIFRKIYGGAVGYYDFGTEEITLDYRKDIIPTLIHEFIHHLNPNWSETRVLKKERQMVNVLSPRQCKNILVALSKCLQ